MQRENTKIKILLIGRTIVVVFAHSLSKLTPPKFDADSQTMSHVNLIIFREHKVLRNKFWSEELTTTASLKDLKTYHQTFVKFLKVVIILQNALNTHEEFTDCFNEDLLNFCRDDCADCLDFNEIKETIESVKVKSDRGFKISKVTLQIYAFVYQKLVDFPSGWFDYDALTTQDLFESVHRVVNVKIYLHHSHITGEILGYAHDLCNMKVRENQNQFSCIAHNFFEFDMFFLLKGIRLSVWGTKDLNVGGSGLTNINFTSLGSQVKFIDTMK